MPPKKLVIDCDPGNDDAMAILMALADVNCDINAITCVAGNCDVTQASLNALRTLKVANRLDVSLTLYLSRSGPYIYNLFILVVYWLLKTPLSNTINNITFLL